MTPEEWHLKHFMQQNLSQLSNWDIWDKCFYSQLDDHHASGAMLPPVPCPKPVDGKEPNVLQIHWNNVVKADSNHTCQSCLDGSKHAAPLLRQFVQTYASCMEQPCMQLFFALAAAMGLIVTFGDTKNAYQHSPLPSKLCYL